LIAIKDIHFDGPVLTPILISYTSGIGGRENLGLLQQHLHGSEVGSVSCPI
jgi:hypothetical protein